MKLFCLTVEIILPRCTSVVLCGLSGVSVCNRLNVPEGFAVSLIALFCVFSLMMASLSCADISLGLIFHIIVKKYTSAVCSICHKITRDQNSPWPNCLSVSNQNEELCIKTVHVKLLLNP